MTQITRGLAALAFAACVTAAGAQAQQSAAPDSSEVLDGIAAVVGNDVVLLSEVEQESFLAASQSGLDPADTTRVRQIRQNVLDQLIDERVVLQEAARQGVTVPDSVVLVRAQDALNRTKQRFPSDAEFEKALSGQGTSEKDLLDRYKTDARKSLLAGVLVDREVGSRVTVTDKDVDEYFAQHHDELPKKPASVRLSQLVLVPSASQALEDAGREKALGLLARIKGGADFAKVASESSDDPGTATRGGDLGWFGQNEMDRTFENAAFSTPPGQIAGPVRTRYGYHLIKVEEQRGGRVHARHILVRVKPSAADVARTRKQMNDLRARIAKGESFSALASAYSMDPGSKDRGGDLGDVPQSQLTPTLRGVVDSLGVGGVSRVLSDDDVFYLFSVTGRSAEVPYQLHEIRTDLQELVRQQRLQDAYETWVKALRSKVFIDVKPRAQG